MVTINEYERRHDKRFKINKEVIAFSLGSIGTVEEVSKDGFSAYFTNSPAVSLNDLVMTSILVRGSSFYIRRLPGQVVWQGKLEYSPFCDIVTQKRGFKFFNLSKLQQAKIDEILYYNTTEANSGCPTAANQTTGQSPILFSG
jgi:hypothetical protein